MVQGLYGESPYNARRYVPPTEVSRHDEILSRLSQTEREVHTIHAKLGSLESATSNLRTGLTEISAQQKDTSVMIAKLVAHQDATSRRKGEKSDLDTWGDMLTMAKDSLLLIGICGAFIVYMSGNFWAADVTVLKREIASMQKQQLIEAESAPLLKLNETLKSFDRRLEWQQRREERQRLRDAAKDGGSKDGSKSE